MPKQNEFGWAAEIELLLLDKQYMPLYHTELDWKVLNTLLNNCTRERYNYMAEKYPGHTRSPFYLEGYDLFDEGGQMVGLKVKGIEMRTPVAKSQIEAIKECTRLFDIAKQALNTIDILPAILGCNPTGFPFQGPQGPRDFINWRAAEVTMITFGLHVNLSLPDKMFTRLDFDRLRARINYFAPAMALLSLNAPFYSGSLWRLANGQVGKSSRTFLRSYYREPLRVKQSPRGTRFHFSLFDMDNSLERICANMELCMGLLLDETSTPESFPESVWRYNLAEVGKYGFEALLFDGHRPKVSVVDLCEILLGIIHSSLNYYNIPVIAIPLLETTLQEHRLPSDRIIERHIETSSFPETLKFCCEFYDRDKFLR